jgi:hypothetical protein
MTLPLVSRAPGSLVPTLAELMQRIAAEGSPGPRQRQEVSSAHYRWHALYGRRVRHQYVERRAGGEVAHVEVAPGVVIVVAAWILDPAAYAGMAIGAPRVTVSTLADLHQLLIEHGFRRSSPDDPT